MYKPGMVEGGDYGKFECKHRSIAYYLEYTILMGLFGKQEMTIEFEGITNDSMDTGVDIV